MSGMFFSGFLFISTHISLDLLSINSAEAYIRWGGKLNSHFMGSCVRNILTNNYQNLTISFRVTVKNVRDVFFETQCSSVRNRFLCATGSRTLVFGVYGRLILATAGLFISFTCYYYKCVVVCRRSELGCNYWHRRRRNLFLQLAAGDLSIPRQSQGGAHSVHLNSVSHWTRSRHQRRSVVQTRRVFTYYCPLKRRRYCFQHRREFLFSFSFFLPPPSERMNTGED